MIAIRARIKGSDIKVTAYNGKRRVGYLTARLGALGRFRDGMTVVRVTDIEVVDDRQRQGVGTRLYERAAQTACKRFQAPLASNVLRTDDSEGFWQKQVRKDRAQCLQWSSGPAQTGKPCAEYVLTCPAPQTLAATLW